MELSNFTGHSNPRLAFAPRVPAKHSQATRHSSQTRRDDRVTSPRVALPARVKRYHGSHLQLPDKSFATRHRNNTLKNLKSYRETLSKEQLIARAMLEIKAQALRDHHAVRRQRVKVRNWIETKAHRWNPAPSSNRMKIPIIIMTTPEGTTCYLSDPNTYHDEKVRHDRLSHSMPS